MWQKGPEFLYHLFKKWHIKQDVEVKEIPDIIVQHADVTVTERNRKTMSVTKIVDLNRISTLQKLLRLTCFLQLIVEKRTFRGIVHCLSTDELKRAENNWIRHVQKDLPDDVMYN